MRDDGVDGTEPPPAHLGGGSINSKARTRFVRAQNAAHKHKQQSMPLHTGAHTPQWDDHAITTFSKRQENMRICAPAAHPHHTRSIIRVGQAVCVDTPPTSRAVCGAAHPTSRATCSATHRAVCGATHPTSRCRRPCNRHAHKPQVTPQDTQTTSTRTCTRTRQPFVHAAAPRPRCCRCGSNHTHAGPADALKAIGTGYGGTEQSATNVCKADTLATAARGGCTR